ncbi:MAG: sigma-70 family RNA polymerase sigma factor [Lentisphaeraceae bacterium]|nr:sigma-70 family RNA polymerase sigma factor [Lentisphaeraceae bacterium]
MSTINDPWLTRQTLLLRVKDRANEEAWTEFESYYRRYLYSILRRMNISPIDSEDISQQVLVKMWEKLPEFDIETRHSKFRSWLATVVRNQAINHLKKNKRHEHQELSDLLPNSSQTELEQLIDKEWRRSILKQAWHMIKEEFEEKTIRAFELSSSGLSTAEVATKLGITESSVYSFKSRVKDRLKNEVRRLNNELG